MERLVNGRCMANLLNSLMYSDDYHSLFSSLWGFCVIRLHYYQTTAIAFNHAYGGEQKLPPIAENHAKYKYYVQSTNQINDFLFCSVPTKIHHPKIQEFDCNSIYFGSITSIKAKISRNWNGKKHEFLLLLYWGKHFYRILFVCLFSRT